MSATTAAPATDHRGAGRSKIPLLVLAAGAGLVLACGAARWSNFAAPPAPEKTLATISLSFGDAPDGAVLVRNATTGALIETVPPRGGGFLRSTMRVMATMREADHLGPAAPFTLTAMAGNRLALTDTATGQTLELEAFGPANAAEFAALLHPANPVMAGLDPAIHASPAVPKAETQK